MGVDAGMYAKKAKKYFWFDRLYNIYQYWDSSTGALRAMCEDVYERRKDGLTRKELIPFLEINLKAWGAEPEDRKYHGFWVKSLIGFVNEFPDDTFVILDDSHDYDEINKLEKGEGYEKIPDDRYVED